MEDMAMSNCSRKHHHHHHHHHHGTLSSSFFWKTVSCNNKNNRKKNNNNKSVRDYWGWWYDDMMIWWAADWARTKLQTLLTHGIEHKWQHTNIPTDKLVAHTRRQTFKFATTTMCNQSYLTFSTWSKPSQSFRLLTPPHHHHHLTASVRTSSAISAISFLISFPSSYFCPQLKHLYHSHNCQFKAAYIYIVYTSVITHSCAFMSGKQGHNAFQISEKNMIWVSGDHTGRRPVFMDERSVWEGNSVTSKCRILHLLKRFPK